MDTTTDPLLGMPRHPVTGLPAVGVLASGRVVWPVLGAAPDDADDADETGDDGGTDDQGSDDQDDRRDDDTQDDDAGTGDDKAKDEGKAKRKDEGSLGKDVVSRSELRKAIAERQKAKKELRDVRQENEELKQANEGAEEKAAREARKAAAEEVEAKYKPLVVRTTARAAMLEAGIQPAKADKAIKLLNMDDLEIDDDGEVTGLTAQIDELKDEWPELFAAPESERKPERRGSRAADGADKRPSKPKQLSATEQQALVLQGKA